MNFPTRTLLLTIFLMASFGREIRAQERPDLLVQTGHAGNVNSVAYSPDMRLLASGGTDRAVRLWDARTGREIRTLLGHSVGIKAVAFGAGGRVLASGSGDFFQGELKLWDVETGREIATLDSNQDFVESLAFASDGRTLAAGHWTGKVTLWDIEKRSEPRVLNGHTAGVQTVAFSPDGTRLVTGSRDSFVKIWDVKTGDVIRPVKVDDWRFTSVAFNSTGTLLAAAGGASGEIRVWNVEGGTERRVTLANGLSPSALAFHPKKDVLAIVGGGGVRLWDANDGKEPSAVENFPGALTSVAFNSDGTRLACGSLGGEVVVWETTGWRKVSTFVRRIQRVLPAFFSPEGDTLTTVNERGTLVRWGTADNQEIHTSKRISISATFSPDGRAFALSGAVRRGDNWVYEIEVWDTKTNRRIYTIGDINRTIYRLTFSPDGRILAAGTGDNVIGSLNGVRTWDAASGRESRAYEGHLSTVDFVRFSGDGRRLVSISQDDTLVVWDVATGGKLQTLKNRPMLNHWAAFFRHDSNILLVGGDKRIDFVEVSSKRVLATVRHHFAFEVSPDGTLLASGNEDGSITLRRVEMKGGAVSLKETGTLRHATGAADFVNFLSFSPDGKVLASGNGDTLTKLWDVAALKELASLIAIDETDWLAVTPDGLFDGSPGARGQVLWRFSRNTFDVLPIEAFFGDFYRQDLVRDLIGGVRPTADETLSDKDRRQPSVNISLPGVQTPSAPVSARHVEVEVEVAENSGGAGARPAAGRRGSGARDVRLFRNGSLVKIWKGDVLGSEHRRVLRAQVALVAGENRLSAYAFNDSNVKSENSTRTVIGADALKRPGTAYVLAVGINEYSNPRYRLSFAVADAEFFSYRLQEQLETPGPFERVKVAKLLDKNATEDNFLRALALLSGADTTTPPADSPLAALRRAEPEDAVVIFFSGHGKAVIGPGPDDSEFYLIPRDMGYAGPRVALEGEALRTLIDHSISGKQLQESLAPIDAGQLVLVIDACNSGQALEMADPRQGPMNSRGLAQLAYEKGMYVLAASQGYQSAVESPRYGHGHLTHALVVEGLSGGDGDGDGKVEAKEWFDYAARRVPEMQSEREEECKADIECVSGNPQELVSQLRVQQERQRPRPFYRREKEARPSFVVARLDPDNSAPRSFAELQRLDLQNHSSYTSRASLSPDGKILASGSDDGTVRLWDVRNAEQLAVLVAHAGAVNALAFDRTGRRLATAGGDQTTKLLSVPDGKVLLTIEQKSSAISSLAFSPDGETLATGDHGGVIRLWSVAGGAELKQFKVDTLWVSHLAFSPDGKTLVGGVNPYLHFCDAASGRKITSLRHDLSFTGQLSFSHDGKTLAVASASGAVGVFEVATPRHLFNLEGHTSWVDSVGFSRDDRLLVSGSKDNTIKLWDLGLRRELRTLKGHLTSVMNVGFGPDGGTLVSSSWNNTVKLWDAPTGDERHSFTWYSSAVRALVGGDELLASGGNDNAIKLWDINTGRELRTLAGYSAAVTSVALSRQAGLLAGGAADGSIKLWDLKDGREVLTLKGHAAGVGGLAFSPDGATLAGGSLDGMIKVWEVATGRELRAWQAHLAAVNALAFDKAGLKLVSGGSDSLLKIWDAATGHEAAAIRGHTAEVRTLAVSPDGGTLASGGDDNNVILWNLVTAQPRRVLSRHEGHVTSLAFSPDGSMLATGSEDRHVVLWSTSDGQFQRFLRVHSKVNAVRFVRGGKELAVGVDSGFIGLWDASTGSQQPPLGGHPGAIVQKKPSPMPFNR